jgi:hypothetical protein
LLIVSNKPIMMSVVILYVVMLYDFMLSVVEPTIEQFLWYYHTEHNDTQHNDTQHTDTQHNDIQHNFVQMGFSVKLTLSSPVEY